MNRRPGRVENYTGAALCWGFINLIWIFMTIWAVYGLVYVLLLAVFLNHLIDRLAAHRAARD
jgi:hypothetical protein